MRFAGSLQRVQTEQSRALIHYFPEDYVFEEPLQFTDPFRYVPHSAVRMAARLVIDRIESDKQLTSDLSEGKMLGVLVCKTPDNGRPCYLAAFSGNVGGKSTIEGFAPPIFDLLAPDGYFKAHEAEITQINHRIQELSASEALTDCRRSLDIKIIDRDTTLNLFREKLAHSKKERDVLRAAGVSQEEDARLIRESQFEKAELKRLKTTLQAEVDSAQAELNALLGEIEYLKKQRAQMSDELQDWIFKQYIVHNALGESASISEVFERQNLIPPGGTGECAAPKLLEYAYRNGLQPLAMGEFWYGKASETAVRVHGHFYPSCTSKCGPLLGFMMSGLTFGRSLVIPKTPVLHSDEHPLAGGGMSSPLSSDTTFSQTYQAYNLIYEDADIIVVEKPSGMPSVPGLDGRVSLQELLEKEYEQTIHAVHRLDMDTSGVIIYAKTAEAGIDLRKQFEEHTIRKCYKARLSPAAEGNVFGNNPSQLALGPSPCGQGGSTVSEHTPLLPATGVHSSTHISLPLAADYDERPRQKVDFKQGKPALTEYEIVSKNADGTIDVHFHPVTGRTHQLRVHSAHALGLCSPILGDLLYGGHTTIQTDSIPDRLHLHALSITFTHPRTGEELTFISDKLSYRDHQNI